MNYKEYKIIEDSVEYWVNKKDAYELKANYIFGFSPKIYLSVFGILFLYSFFIKDYNFPITVDASSESTAKKYTIFSKPDNKSKIILKDEETVDLIITGETKYYYKVEFNKDDKIIQGYINKKKLNK
jgi:hypothetical protein